MAVYTGVDRRTLDKIQAVCEAAPGKRRGFSRIERLESAPHTSELDRASFFEKVDSGLTLPLAPLEREREA